MKTLIIGICGGTGSGKTTIAKKVVETIGPDRVVLIEQDSYYRDLGEIPLDNRRIANFDQPGSVDSDLMVEHLETLLNGNTAEIPLYDFTTHTRMDEVMVVEPKAVVIVEGILILTEPKVLELLEIKVFVDTPDDIRLVRRIRRDMEERGRTLLQTLEQYERTIRPMHYQFVEPSRHHADIIIPEGTELGVTVDLLCGLIREKLGEVDSSRTA